MSSSEDTNAPPSVTYGFIGIGVMGWGMATNLRAKIPKSSLLIICELNSTRLNQFISQTSGLIKVAASPREVALQAVSIPPLSYPYQSTYLKSTNI
jgi:hypothetical protein